MVGHKILILGIEVRFLGGEPLFQCSSVVEHRTVNPYVVGSIPTTGANRAFTQAVTRADCKSVDLVQSWFDSKNAHQLQELSCYI